MALAAVILFFQRKFFGSTSYPNLLDDGFVNLHQPLIVHTTCCLLVIPPETFISDAAFYSVLDRRDGNPAMRATTAAEAANLAEACTTSCCFFCVPNLVPSEENLEYETYTCATDTEYALDSQSVVCRIKVFETANCSDSLANR